MNPGGLSPRTRLAILGLLFAAGILNYVDRSIISVLKPMLQQDLGWTDDDYGHLTAIFQLAAAVTYLVAGPIIDRLGWRWGNPLGVGAWSLAAMAHALANTIGQFTIVRIALGSTEAFGTPLAVKTVASFFSIKDRSFALGLQNASGNIGAIATPLIIPGVALAFGWKACFVIAGGLGLIWVAIWIALTARLKAPVETGAIEAPIAVKPAPLSQVLTDRRTWAIAGAKVLSDVNWWFLLFWVPDLLHRVFHLEVSEFGLPLAAIFALAGTGSLVGGYMSGRLIAAGFSLNAGRKLTMLGCACLMLPIYTVTMVDNYWLAVVILGIGLAGHQGFSVSIFSLTADMVPNSRVATVISIGALCGNLAGMGILRLAGYWIGEGYGFGPFLILASVSYFLALGWLHLLVPKIREHA